MESAELADLRVLVTGAASGVGEATARLFASRGAAVAVCDMNSAGAATVAESIEADGGRAAAVVADISTEADVVRMVDESVAALGGLNAAHINAATIAAFGGVLSTTTQQWDFTFNVNLRGAYMTAREVLPHMLEAGGGVLCFTGSDTALRTTRDYAAYLSSKHGVIGLARSIAVDYGMKGIRSNVVTPGVTDTPGLRVAYSTGDRDPEAGVRAAARFSVLGRVGLPEDVAEAVTFLCSRRAKYITGANLVVDGGMTVLYEAE